VLQLIKHEDDGGAAKELGGAGRNALDMLSAVFTMFFVWAS